MSIWKKKLKRVHLDNNKNGRVNGGLNERDITHLLLGALFTLLILGTLGMPYLTSLPQILTTLTVVVLLVGFWSSYLLEFYKTEIFSSYLKVFLFGVLTILPFILLEIFIQQKWPLLFLPMTLISMIVALGYSRRLAIANLLFQSFLIWFLVETPYQNDFFMHLPGMIIATLGMSNLRTRAKLIKLGAMAGISHCIIIIAYQILKTPGADLNDLKIGFFGFTNGLVSGFIILGILPFIERWFQITTDQSLLELADLNHQLLKDLALRAPGTYHHSLRVSNLAEAATEAIQGNTLLSRVGSYYHDIGKLNKPDYFIENEPASSNKHKALTPSMSTLIITAHVKDGMELALYHKIPKNIIDFISQHHGTSVIKYFYHAALQNSEPTDNHNLPEITEESFRYPGPQPQSKESGIVLLADSVEAASRSIDDITPAKLEGLVHEVIMEKLLDGQLDESNLTMKEFKIIEASFIRMLVAIFHPRIKYPDQTIS
jgi:cyclic-di-AMP phosphodiesterase PgpH